MLFEDLGLRPEILRVLTAKGYTEPSPIQAKAIPAVLTGGDVIACAQTGTGKTAAFSLPLLHHLPDRVTKGAAPRIRVLVLTPTRELAAQVGDNITTYGQDLPLKTAVVFGGVNINPQIDTLRRGVHILVATPGRLLDHLQQRTVDLSSVDVFVLDEADRMLDMGFIRDVRKIIAKLPAKRQNLLFSATFTYEIRALAAEFLNDPVTIDIAKKENDEVLIDQIVHMVDKTRKRELLSDLIRKGDWQQVLVFTRTKHGANRLSQQLERDGICAAAIHGNKSQAARTKALQGFKDGTVRVLVATDIAARGLDIMQLPHVVNYELPQVPEDYVHRIGRTGRAGSKGEARSLVAREEQGLLHGIERLLKFKITRVDMPEYLAPRPQQAGQDGFEDRPEREERRPPRPAPRQHAPSHHRNEPRAPRPQREGSDSRRPNHEQHRGPQRGPRDSNSNQRSGQRGGQRGDRRGGGSRNNHSSLRAPHNAQHNHPIDDSIGQSDPRGGRDPRNRAFDYREPKIPVLTSHEIPAKKSVLSRIFGNWS